LGTQWSCGKPSCVFLEYGKRTLQGISDGNRRVGLDPVPHRGRVRRARVMEMSQGFAHLHGSKAQVIQKPSGCALASALLAGSHSIAFLEVMPYPG